MIDEAHEVNAEVRDAMRRRFRRTLATVMTVQVVTLLLLWWLQTYFSP